MKKKDIIEALIKKYEDCRKKIIENENPNMRDFYEGQKIAYDNALTYLGFDTMILLIKQDNKSA